MDALVLITEWTGFRVPNKEKLGAAINAKMGFFVASTVDILSKVRFDYYGKGILEC